MTGTLARSVMASNCRRRSSGILTPVGLSFVATR
jgi:hypothetical protein